MVEIALEGFDGVHGKLGAPFFNVSLGPMAVEANGCIGEIFRESERIIAFAFDNVADLASGVEIVDGAGGVG